MLRLGGRTDGELFVLVLVLAVFEKSSWFPPFGFVEGLVGWCQSEGDEVSLIRFILVGGGVTAAIEDVDIRIKV